MNFLDHFYEGIASKMKSKKSRHEFLIAILEYYYEGIEPEFKNEVADVGFQGIRYSLDKARAGRLGGQAKPQANTEANIEAESEEEANLVIGIGKGIEENPPNGGQKSNFPLQCLNAFNLEFGTTYCELPGEIEHYLERMSATYSLDEVIAMLRFKHGEWGGGKFQNCLTPHTLFSRKHFEQYLQQSKMPKPTQKGGVDESVFDKYA